MAGGKGQCPCCHQTSTRGGVKQKGTFGGSSRFSLAHVPHFGSQTPSGPKYYAHCSTTGGTARMRATSLGVSDRPTYVRSVNNLGPHVGPGTYTYLNSHMKSTSPLDGPMFSRMTMIPRREYCVGQPPIKDKSAFPSPGDYKIPSSVGNSRKSTIGLPLTDIDSGCDDSMMLDSGGLSTSSAYTFSKFPRLKEPSNLSMSPNGKLYYSHSKICTGKDYMKDSQSCFMVSGKRSRMGNDDYDAGPGSYDLRVERCGRCDSRMASTTTAF